ncbi:MAG: adenylyl-sulfate kinase [Planctomycetes bacterium]|nr:adenylyl-sulfate kinase [Planctomycetota bacterium]
METLEPNIEHRTSAIPREQMDIVVIGHVDHGKSTLVGRLLADTGSLPEGKLEQVQQACRRHAKPFEYAFLLDALKDEQSQGITIDSARCFFRTARREYLIIDAPGHIEFLKNMISGAARAEAGLLVIDVAEGVQENSRRHGYLMSMLGIRQIAVCVNKMDLVGYRQDAFEAVRDEYGRFLAKIGLGAMAFIPISAREGDNVAWKNGMVEYWNNGILGSNNDPPHHSTIPSFHRSNLPWYTGPTILELLDTLQKEPAPVDKPLRLPVQDIYKFTEQGDDRRIVAGRIATGRLHVGDEVVFLPSAKRSRIQSVERWNGTMECRNNGMMGRRGAQPTQYSTFPSFQHSNLSAAQAGESTGVTLETQVYIKPGELMVRADEPAPCSSTKLEANLFWLSPNPMVMGKRYKLKLHAARAAAYLTAVHTVIDASNLSTVANRRQIERHDVAHVTLETLKPVACDPAMDIPSTGRFVIIDDYEIAGGGVILSAEPVSNTLVQEHVRQRNRAWVRSRISPQERAGRHNQRPALVVICGPDGGDMETLGRAVEEHLHRAGRLAYYLGLSNQLLGLNADLNALGGREEFLRRLGETAHLFTDAGLIVITTIADLDDFELQTLEALNQPSELVVVSVGDTQLSRRRPDLVLDKVDRDALSALHTLLQQKQYIQDYQI